MCLSSVRQQHLNVGAVVSPEDDIQEIPPVPECTTASPLYTQFPASPHFLDTNVVLLLSYIYVTSAVSWFSLVELVNKIL